MKSMKANDNPPYASSYSWSSFYKSGIIGTTPETELILTPQLEQIEVATESATHPLLEAPRTFQDSIFAIFYLFKYS